MQNNFAVTYDATEKRDRARDFANKYQLPFVSPNEENNFKFLLIFTSEHLELKQNNTKQKPIYIDFLLGNILQRLQKNAGKELLRKALGLKPNTQTTIIDATAGFGQDAILMASFGCKVTMLERSCILHALLEDGLNRFKQNTQFHFDIGLIVTDAIAYLKKLTPEECPDVIYLDPMYPHHQKNVLAKKEMQWIRQIVGDDPDADSLFEIAQQKATKRVVVKRPRLAEPLNKAQPDFSITGRGQRFDIYLKKSGL